MSLRNNEPHRLTGELKTALQYIAVSVSAANDWIRYVAPEWSANIL